MINYKDTIFLPKTSFKMKANLPHLEEKILAQWEKNNLHETMEKNSKDRPNFVIHDGPPYANGHIHIGHALNKILKDIINRGKYLLGKNISFIPGWDCHGLPIESEVKKKYPKLTLEEIRNNPIKFRKECRKFAKRWIEIQSKEMKRLGLFITWKNIYSTMTSHAEAQIVDELGQFLMNKSLYRGHKPVFWSVVEQTALAEAEVEYLDKTSSSIYVTFPVKNTKLTHIQDASCVIWTTTPWTIPANKAICYHKDVKYCVIEINPSSSSLLKQPQKIIIAQELLATLIKEIGIEKHSLIASFKGAELKDTICYHPLHKSGYTHDIPLLPAEHVTIESGTGLVHTAPAHGLDDYNVGQEFGLNSQSTVQDDGTYNTSVPLFAGEHIYRVDDKVQEQLQIQNNLLFSTTVKHSYPHSWRSKTPLIYRTTSQLFISMNENNLRNKSLESINQVSWFPENSIRRIKSMVEQRPDWCISRQRLWGVPLTIFLNKKTGEILRDQTIHKKIVKAIHENSSDIWFEKDPRHFLEPEYNPEEYLPIYDILDVWFESGVTHAFVLQAKQLDYPAHLYVEGSDQHRGWFQSSLLTSCGINGYAPYKNVVTHGFVLDEKRRKMSKSLGNVIKPQDIISQHGAEILRLWVVGSDYFQDVTISQQSINHTKDRYRRFRNTIRYLLSSLSDNQQTSFDYEKLPELEQWILHKLHKLHQDFRKSYDNYDFQKLFVKLHTFCTSDLSSFYFDIRKDTLYCDAKNNPKRQANLYVMNEIFHYLCLWLSPVLCFTTDEAWQNRYQKHIHLENIIDPPKNWDNPKLAKKFKDIRKIRSAITSALEEKRNNGFINSNLEAHIFLYDPQNILQKTCWEELTITSFATVIQEEIPEKTTQLDDDLNIGIVVKKTKGQKCPRCWKFFDNKNQETCSRCSKVIQNL